MPVNIVNHDYYQAQKRWALVRAIVENNAMCYLPTIDINDPVRSEAYKRAGVLTNYTRLTKEGLTGLIFRKKPTIKLPVELEYLLTDVNGAGFTIEQFSQKKTWGKYYKQEEVDYSLNILK